MLPFNTGKVARKDAKLNLQAVIQKDARKEIANPIYDKAWYQGRSLAIEKRCIKKRRDKVCSEKLKARLENQDMNIDYTKSI